VLPCILFEDEHLLVVNKPAGLNTHAPSPLGGEGIYDWLRNREPRWASLAIIHRLDKQTSGVLVFGLSPAANRSLSAQFERREVRKNYLLVTDRLEAAIPPRHRSTITKAGDKFLSKPWRPGAELAETEFEPVSSAGVKEYLGHTPLPCNTRLVIARPLTGRTHQVRLHAADAGFPVLGDTLYGGTNSGRVHLHAWEIAFAHPGTGKEVRFRAPFDFGSPTEQIRQAIIESDKTNAFRLIHGEADEHPGLYADKLGEYILMQSDTAPGSALLERPEALATQHNTKGIYHKVLKRHTRGAGTEASPVPIYGKRAPARFQILENGLKFELSFEEGYSIGLFLDQRDNRRRLLTGHIAASFPLFDQGASKPPRILNTFAYTCGFSVVAASSGAHSTSLDLSKKYLEWGRRNFELNGLDPSHHDFIYGDTFSWLKRLQRKERLFDLIILDPPTFSQSREHGVFRAEKDYGELVNTALPLLSDGGVMLASSNASGWKAEDFVAMLRLTVRKHGKEISAFHFAPQPPDFPVSRAEPAYLKTAWCRISGSR
jgi:23S rRNA (cytosine1962-C5)-methyltransferase